MIAFTQSKSLWEVLPRLPMNEYAVVAIDEDLDPNVKSYPNVFMGSILLPPYPILMHATNGDFVTFDNMYAQYLMSPEVDSFITTILAGVLLKNVNIIFYIDENNFSNIGSIINNYIQYSYGTNTYSVNDASILLGYSIPREVSFSKAGFIKLLSTMYLDDIIDCDTFIMRYPVGDMLIPPVVNKLIADINPYLESNDYSFNGYLDYFLRLISNAKGIGCTPKVVFRRDV